MPSIPDPAYGYRPDGLVAVRRRVRLVRHHIGPGPYLVFRSGVVSAGDGGSGDGGPGVIGPGDGGPGDGGPGDVGPGALLALLAAHGSASGFVTDGALADLTRRAAPGCPVHTIPDAIPSGVFRGVLAAAPPDDATLALWRRVLVCDGGRVLLVGEGDIAPERLAAAGLRLRWAGREYWRFGAPVVVLQSLPQRPPGA